jgi:hypothetical protein
MAPAAQGGLALPPLPMSSGDRPTTALAVVLANCTAGEPGATIPGMAEDGSLTYSSAPSSAAAERSNPRLAIGRIEGEAQSQSRAKDDAD